MTNSYGAAILIFVGLMLAGGTYSFAKQKMPKVIVAVLGACSVMAVAAGVLRWR
jgi:hypothetical protein